MKTANTKSVGGSNTPAAKGERILIGIGILLIATWAFFATTHIQSWIELKEHLRSAPDRYEVSDQGILTLLITPLLGIFAALFIKSANGRKRHQAPLKIFPALGLTMLGITSLAAPLAVIDNKMSWYVNSASTTPYVMCEEMRHGKGKNTWRSFVYVRNDIGCHNQGHQRKSKKN